MVIRQTRIKELVKLITNKKFTQSTCQEYKLCELNSTFFFFFFVSCERVLLNASVCSTWSFQYSDLLPLSPPSTICPHASGQPDCLLKSDQSQSPFRSHTSLSIRRTVPRNCELSILSNTVAPVWEGRSTLR